MTFLPFPFSISFQIFFRLLPKIRQSLPCILTIPKVFHLSNNLKNPTNGQTNSTNRSKLQFLKFNKISEHVSGHQVCRAANPGTHGPSVPVTREAKSSALT
ncbi:hypothetical protein Prudu_001182 [Prunus dulcis]|uniref:Uncharacterized protein n=1 Tax=Prunus dulcis TaxID=3755 RepID=A0A4Y1QN20_PRUDU|nr:hypothetical protein Prudu_001182 [Prunus dulcis]